MVTDKTSRLACHYTVYYQCGHCTDLATDGTLPEQCPKPDCEEGLDTLKNWETHTTVSATDLPPTVIGGDLSAL